MITAVAKSKYERIRNIEYSRFDRIMAISLWPHFFGPPCTSDMNDRPRVCWCLTLSP